MPRIYKRKIPTNGKKMRGDWSEENLREAVRRIYANEIGLNEAARYYEIPSRTLRRRMGTGNFCKGKLGPSCILGEENEKNLVEHIKRLECAGFTPDKKMMKSLAFQYAEKLGIKHTFSKETQMAGRDWLLAFLDRNKELAIKKSNSSQEMTKKVKNFFDRLLTTYEENKLLNKPSQIYYMDESEIQIINTQVLDDEEATVITCCNAEGCFLPPVLIMKGKNIEKDFLNGLPPGSKVYMNTKSSNISTELFMNWLSDHFAPIKGHGKALLILDSNSSHCNAAEMLEFIDYNNIIIICLPTNKQLQPLDNGFFKPLKDYFKQETKQWMLEHPEEKLSQYQTGCLLGKAWSKAASVDVALSGFSATGIYPYNPHVISDYVSAVTDYAENNNSTETEIFSSECHTDPWTSHLEENEISNFIINEKQIEIQASELDENDVSNFTDKENSIDVAGPSGVQLAERNPSTSSSTYSESPSKYLNVFISIPKFPIPCNKLKQTATLVITAENVQQTKEAIENHNPISTFSDQKNKYLQQLENSEAIDEIISTSDDDDNLCLECFEECFSYTPENWIQCETCFRKMHKNCTMYKIKCNYCGREERRKEFKRRRKQN